MGPLPAHVNCCPSLGRNSNWDLSRESACTNPPRPLALPAQGAAQPLATGSLEMEFLIGFTQPALGAFPGTSCLPLPRGAGLRPPGLPEQVRAPTCPSRQEKAEVAAHPMARRSLGSSGRGLGVSTLQGPGLLEGLHLVAEARPLPHLALPMEQPVFSHPGPSPGAWAACLMLAPSSSTLVLFGSRGASVLSTARRQAALSTQTSCIDPASRSRVLVVRDSGTAAAELP